MAQAATHTLFVAVLDSASGKPVGNASIRLRYAGMVATASDSGTATFHLPPTGFETIEVRRVGYAPLATTITLGRSARTEVVFELQPIVQVLPTVEVTEMEQHRFLAVRGFYDRKSRLRGAFLGPKEISALHPSKMSDIMRRVPGATVTRNSSGGSRLRLRSVQDCPPHVYVDGARFIIEPETATRGVFQGTAQRRTSRGRAMPPGYGIDELSADMIAAVEVYTSAAQVPPEYNMTGSVCGVVLVWTGPRWM
ncbi:MAG: TonB-dependent receptor [Gemmatimonadaceae bacterium]|nr:TonB-dependent receptor [Gemmatimonadaceae bacterium]